MVFSNSRDAGITRRGGTLEARDLSSWWLEDHKASWVTKKTVGKEKG